MDKSKNLCGTIWALSKRGEQLYNHALKACKDEQPLVVYETMQHWTQCRLERLAAEKELDTMLDKI